MMHNEALRRDLATLKATVVVILFHALIFTGCRVNDPIVGVVRTTSGRPCDSLDIKLITTQHGVPSEELIATTDANGLFSFRGAAWLQEVDSLVVSKPGTNLRVGHHFSSYRGVLDVRWDDGGIIAAPPVADMHYHASMRAHNLFGETVHDASREGVVAKVPNDLIWYYEHKKLNVWSKGDWKMAPRLSHKNIMKARTDVELKKRFADLLEGRVRPANKNNAFTHYTQATQPHRVDGNVKLGYNAISPFEQNLNSSCVTRQLGSWFKTKMPVAWGKRLGGESYQKDVMTHWENFLYEHGLMKQQAQDVNGMPWRFLEHGSDLTEYPGSSFLVTSAEGGHFLQHELFPNQIRYDLAARSNDEQTRLIKKWMRIPAGSLSPMARSSIETVTALYEDKVRRKEKTYGTQLAPDDDLYRAVNTALINELQENIKATKALDPPVHMVTIAHLSYNGMVGHAPALDDATWFGKLLGRKVYDIRVSDDPSYLRQWRNLFFTVPVVNVFGKALMDGLLDTTNGAKRILIDLKHSDLVTRKYFYDNLMKLPDGKVIPPICSHCAATGMSEVYWSPFNNEYLIQKDPLVRTFYPFGINLYDEEVIRIARASGIIGIPLEQRVLGGYLDHAVSWNMFVKNGEWRKNRTGDKMKRWKHSKELFKWLEVQVIEGKNARLDSAVVQLERIKGQYRRNYSTSDQKELLDLATEDFISVAPFIQNLFYMVDLIYEDLKQNRLDLPQDSVHYYAWRNLCIGSDLDGLVDPMDIIPTATNYPRFRESLEAYIPLFLFFRDLERPRLIAKEMRSSYRVEEQYFNADWTMQKAMDALFYGNLRDFTIKNIR